MAVGKSAVGRNLAKKLKRHFVDLDRAIEKKEGKKVREIFSENGEPYFRQAEKQALAEVLAQSSQIIATGGGVIMDQDNLALLKEKSLLVCLTASTEVILKRVGNGTKRPLLKGTNREERIEQLLGERAKQYAQAHLSVDTSDATIDQVVDNIIAQLDAPASHDANVDG
ncbi:MAG: shikimate kinase [Deltaproteobacteria bacterium]|nr:shikimate kinase [Deltaproteobacteria bacterium]